MSEALRKPYKPPTLKKLTVKQAEVSLLGAARNGDQNARELLELIYPEQLVKS
jgi:hypothetical protein